MSKSTTSNVNRKAIIDQTFAAIVAIQAERREQERRVIEENREWAAATNTSVDDLRGLFA